MGVANGKYHKVGLETKMKLEMAAIKEEDNSLFKGLGKNHDKSFTKQMQGGDKSPSQVNEGGVEDYLRTY